MSHGGVINQQSDWQKTEQPESVSSDSRNLPLHQHIQNLGATVKLSLAQLVQTQACYFHKYTIYTISFFHVLQINLDSTYKFWSSKENYEADEPQVCSGIWGFETQQCTATVINYSHLAKPEYWLWQSKLLTRERKMCTCSHALEYSCCYSIRGYLVTKKPQTQNFI